MSLTPKRRTTEKSLARSQRNGRKSRGAVTPDGKARAAQGNLRHGFYSEAPEEVLIALGEDPADYRRLRESLENNLSEGLEGELVRRIARVLWLMQRADRTQDGLAVKRVRSGTQMEQLLTGPRLIEIHEIYQRLLALARGLNNPHFFPAEEEIQAFEHGFGPTAPADIQKLFPLLRAYGNAAAKAPGPANEDGGPDPLPPSAAEQEKESTLKQLQAALNVVSRHYLMTRDQLLEESDQVRSPENIAALMAPRDENAMLMQRMEDSSLRQLWRLTNILVKVRNGALA